MVSIRVTEEKDLFGVAETVIAELLRTGRHVLALKGDLGAGKTAFTKALGNVLGVQEDITSPTFVIMKSYPLHTKAFDLLTHIDAYRIEDEEELRVLGFSALSENTRNLMVIEWPERVLGLMPADAFVVTFTILDGEDRLITYGD